VASRLLESGFLLPLQIVGASRLLESFDTMSSRSVKQMAAVVKNSAKLLQGGRIGLMKLSVVKEFIDYLDGLLDHLL
jgi:hypothetical protein